MKTLKNMEMYEKTLKFHGNLLKTHGKHEKMKINGKHM